MHEDAVTPLKSLAHARLVFVLNLFVPGFGTILSGCLAAERNENTVLTGFFLGLMQMCTSWMLLAGWIWAVVLSVQIIDETKKDLKERNETTEIADLEEAQRVLPKYDHDEIEDL